MPSIAQLQARVDRGMALLDAQNPGWESKVKLESLDLTSGDRCILGQVYCNDDSVRFFGYELGCKALFGGMRGYERDSATHGFYTQADDSHLVYARLEKLWAAALRARITHAARDTDLAMSGD